MHVCMCACDHACSCVCICDHSSKNDLDKIIIARESKMDESKTMNPKLILVTEPVDSSWSLVRIARERPPTGWKDFFRRKDVLIELEAIDRRLHSLGAYFPEKKNIFKAFELTPLNSIKVVILAQDPYHATSKIDGKCIATGLAFDVGPFNKIPSSLNNMFKELSSDLGIDKPLCGDLRSWAVQGTFLYNMCSTVKPHIAKSHGSIWRGFSLKVIHTILDVNPNVPFVLLGKEAQSIRSDVRNRFFSIETSHPSGLSVARGFAGSKIYSQIDTYLEANGVDPIDWAL